MHASLQFAHIPAADGRNGWWECLPGAAPARSVSGELHADWVVIGGGITGLCAARRLAELAPGASIALVEADRIGRATAGRNSGFFVDLPHDISSESYSRSIEADLADIRLQRHGIDYVRDAVRTHGIDCDWRDEGKYHASVNPKGQAALRHFADGLERIGEPYQWLDEAGIRAVTGSPLYRGGILTPGCSTAQPAALMRGLAATLPANVQVYEMSCVRRIEARGGRQQLRFDHGTLDAAQVVLCTNAYAAASSADTAGLLPVYTFASMTRELTRDEVARLGGQRAWSLIPADPMGTTVRRLITDRICIRNHFAFRPSLAVSDADLERARRLHQRSFARRFPMLDGVTFDYTWGGPLCLSTNNGALFGRREDGLYQAIGCNGLGLSRGSASGKLIADYALGHGSTLVDQLLQQPVPRALPVRPLSNLAVSATIWAKEWRAGAER
ncbi:MAG: Gamma-glutamylputrescine oxidoreductase [Burkholderia plantarii]|nr:MAG: Gamma-glutamylputrescine oxidoreductase [Burkholderia plantarii]